MTEAISQMTAGTPPYATTTLLELSIGGPATVSGKIQDVVNSVLNVSGGITGGLNLTYNTALGSATGAIVTFGSLTAGSGYPGGSAILSCGAITAGSGYAAGSYAGVPLTDSTNGAATGAIATIVVGSDGLVKSVTITNGGTASAG